jgi:hypothetical protein
VSCEVRVVVVKVDEVTPATTDSFSDHWYSSGAEPVAITENVAVDPRGAVGVAGSRVMTGGWE